MKYLDKISVLSNAIKVDEELLFPKKLLLFPSNEKNVYFEF